MKYHYPAVIVVEGATDKALLSSFLDSEIVITNGSDVPRETIDYLREAAKASTVVVLTDPDSPGKRIRDVLDGEIPGLLHAYVPKAKCIKGHKVGIAESSVDAIMEALSHVVPAPKGKEGTMTYADLFELGLLGGDNAARNREALCLRYHLGSCNGKTLLKRINALNLSKEEIRSVIHG